MNDERDVHTGIGPKVVEVKQIFYDDRMERSLAALVAAENTLIVAESTWAGIMGVVKSIFGPAAEVSSFFE